MEILVSIIAPCFNAAAYIQQTIVSILNQSYTHWELLIIDDCSTDNSAEVIGSYLGDPRIRLYRQDTNKGPGPARNVGIAAAKGKIIAFIDSDDLWSPMKLKLQVAFFLKNFNVALVFCDYEQMDQNGRLLSRVVRAPAVVDYRMLLKSNFIGGLTAAYNVEIVGKRYFVSHGHEDYILWLSILRDGYKAYNLQLPLAQYRLTSASRSSNKFRTATYQWNVYRDFEHLTLARSCYQMLFYILYGIKKHF
jgi:teichuronic acid biosynthesis glycosyltransferase TuaG